VDEIEIERIGGFAGFGGSSRLRSMGAVRVDRLSAADREKVDALFRRGDAGSGAVRDGFAYRLTRNGPSGRETVTVPEAEIPAALAASVRDRLE
jgi:hypothetical protein